MKTLLTDRHPFSKLMILTLTSCLASAFYVFNRFSQYDLLVFVDRPSYVHGLWTFAI